jgi:hypothetical protein
MVLTRYADHPVTHLIHCVCSCQNTFSVPNTTTWCGVGFSYSAKSCTDLQHETYYHAGCGSLASGGSRLYDCNSTSKSNLFKICSMCTNAQYFFDAAVRLSNYYSSPHCSATPSSVQNFSKATSTFARRIACEIYSIHYHASITSLNDILSTDSCSASSTDMSYALTSPADAYSASVVYIASIPASAGSG